MLVTGSDAPSQNSQLLILAELIETVRNLHPIARREEIEMEDIGRRRLPVEVVENALIVADVADGLSVDHKRNLRVISQRMKKTVGIRRDCARAVSDRLAELASGIESR